MNAKKHEVPEALLINLLADYKKPEDLIGENGLLKQLAKLLVERASRSVPKFRACCEISHSTFNPV